ncbi:RNA-binding protein [Aquibacillus halophilus]|uniref:RNA-binding protein n=1 Tax=Aquibacillus halophilus TaxID=930132 RepID=A0A6A8DEI2_9BACI|nr:YlmH/Sll1252 family protein [Aquibacillus halophilus]MRH42181.1 RNA-binding protein [Aquibacillus halophilus]
MDIYQHFRKEEHAFIDQVLSWRDNVQQNYQVKVSDFLNPREQKIFTSIIGKNEDYTWGLFGGGADTERRRAVLAPFYEEISIDDYGITLLEARYPTKFITLEHRDVLGAFLSMGIKRKKLGDLVVQNGIIHIIVSSEIDTYVKLNLKEIKKSKVTFEDVPLKNLLSENETWESQATTVTSLRLDVIIKEIYNISRQSAATYIQKGLVKVNFKIVENPAFQLEESDLISLRGKGRSKLKEIQGLSKKEKWKITTEKLK